MSTGLSECVYNGKIYLMLLSIALFLQIPLYSVECDALVGYIILGTHEIFINRSMCYSHSFLVGLSYNLFPIVILNLHSYHFNIVK